MKILGIEDGKVLNAVPPTTATGVAQANKNKDNPQTLPLRKQDTSKGERENKKKIINVNENISSLLCS